MGYRVFLFDEKGNIKQIPTRLHEKLYRDENAEALPEYAGQRVRSASVYLDVRDRKPVKIVDIECGYFSFDSTGKVDRNEIEAEHEEVGKILGATVSAQQSDVLSTLKPDLVALKYKDRFKWKITPEEIRRLEDLIFRHKFS